LLKANALHYGFGHDAEHYSVMTQHAAWGMLNQCPDGQRHATSVQPNCQVFNGPTIRLAATFARVVRDFFHADSPIGGCH
jgi:hypothetical protein